MRFYPLTSAGRIRHTCISRFLDALSLYSLLDHLTSIFANSADQDQTALIRRHNVCL